MSSQLLPSIGDPIDAVETPALIVDLDAFERNVAKLAGFAKGAGVRLRPHAKTHKCPAIALRQIAAGAIGQCCQKVGEAEALVRGGVADVLVSNQVVGERKLRRLAALAADARVALCFDSAEQVAKAGEVARDFGVELGAYVEIDVGMARCGVPPGAPAVELAKAIAGTAGLRFEGLQAYHGTAQHMTYAKREEAIAGAGRLVSDTVERLHGAGLPPSFVTGAGTGTFRFEGASGIWNELQAGSYVFMDTDYARIGDRASDRYTEFEHSLFVLASVMSVPVAGRAVVDAGLKSYSAEKGAPWVADIEGAEVTGVSDEHGKIELGRAARPLRLGEKLRLIPGHCDPTVNLHDWYIGVRRGRVEALWPIAARGASQ
jgi:D-serine deaminase-like pyridoxal phosphate-dependent protein